MFEPERARCWNGGRRGSWCYNRKQHRRHSSTRCKHGCRWQLQHVLGNGSCHCIAVFLACGRWGFASQASALDPTGPVTITADLGDQKKLRAVDISWEFPAKSFTVAVSTDGVKWSEVFATDTNVLSSVSIQLGSISASRVRVVMHEVRFLVLCCCFAAWLALVAGISVLSRSCSVWHKRAGCSCAAPANHCRGLCGGSRQRRCSRQILCELCRGGRPLFEQGIAQRAACA